MSNGTVIYYGGFALPDKSASANRVVSNGKLFSALGYRTVFLGVSDEDDFKIKKIGESMFVLPRAKSSKEWFKRMTDVSNTENIIKENPDTKAVILYNSPFLTLLRFKGFLKKKNIRLIYDCTEWTGDTDGSYLKKAFKKIDGFFIRNFAGRVSDKMIVISSMMEKKYKNHVPCVRIPPLVDISDSVWHQKKENDENKFVFCFAGVPDGKKESLDAVVKAFSAVKNESVILRIVGVTREQFVKLYPKIEINNNVIFEGFVSHAQAVKFILSCDCYIFIRESDRRNNAGFPTKFAESFTAGVPVITTDVSDVREYIEKSGNGTVLPSTDEKEIAEAMRKQIEKGKKNYNLNSEFDYNSYKNKIKDLFV